MSVSRRDPPPAPRVSVIIVSWNSREFLPGCLASVEGQTHPEVETIVVDNGSVDGSADLVAERLPGAILIRNNENAGFCRANNAALKRSTGLFILCLNADAVLEPDFLEKALPAFHGDPSVGIVAGKIRRFDGRSLDSAGQVLTRARRVRDRGYGEPDTGRFDEPCEVFSACGAAALYRRAMVEEISRNGEFFDESFFSFGEDMDVAWRARSAGWRCRYVPGAAGGHFRGGSQRGGASFLGRLSQMARRPPQMRAHIVKNRYLMILKNDTLGAFIRDLPFIAGWEIVQWGYILLAAPGTIPHLWRLRSTFARAWRLRRERAAAGKAGA